VAAARFAGLIGAVGVAVALVLTYPLPLHLREAFLDDGAHDAYQFAWNLWWVRESLLSLHTNPFHTTYLFYPDGTGLLFHTFSFTLGLASLPLQLAGGPAVAQNVLVMAAPALTVVLVALLAREVASDPWAAVAAGLVAASSPMAVFFVPIVYLSCTYLVAALLLAWWRLQSRRRPADVAVALVVLPALLFASQEYAMMTVALLALDTLWRAAAPRPVALGAPWPGGTLAFWAIAAVGLGLLAWAASSSPAQPPPPGQALISGAYVAALVTPPWLVPPPNPFLNTYYLGTIPLLLVPVAILCGGRRTAFWLVATAAMAVMALGPYIVLRLPELGTLPPEGIPLGLPGPYLLIERLVPFLRFLRAIHRWLVPAHVALAVVTALAVAGLRRRVVRPAPRAALTAAVLALLVAGAAVDARGLRARLAPATIPAGYAILRDDPQPAAILELPTGFIGSYWAKFSSQYMYWQTAHGKYLLDGTVARLPPGRRPAIGRSIDDLWGLPYVKYAVVHRDLLALAHPAAQTQAQRLEPLIRAHGDLVAQDGAMEVYRLRTFQPESVR
jgi:hypothetical protein